MQRIHGNCQGLCSCGGAWQGDGRCNLPSSLAKWVGSGVHVEVSRAGGDKSERKCDIGKCDAVRGRARKRIHGSRVWNGAGCRAVSVAEPNYGRRRGCSKTSRAVQMDCCGGARHAGEGNSHAGWDIHGIGIRKCSGRGGNRLSVVFDSGTALRHKQVDTDFATWVPVENRMPQKNKFMQTGKSLR